MLMGCESCLFVLDQPRLSDCPWTSQPDANRARPSGGNIGVCLVHQDFYEPPVLPVLGSQRVHKLASSCEPLSFSAVSECTCAEAMPLPAACLNGICATGGELWRTKCDSWRKPHGLHCNSVTWWCALDSGNRRRAAAQAELARQKPAAKLAAGGPGVAALPRLREEQQAYPGPLVCAVCGRASLRPPHRGPRPCR